MKENASLKQWIHKYSKFNLSFKELRKLWCFFIWIIFDFKDEWKPHFKKKPNFKLINERDGMVFIYELKGLKIFTYSNKKLYNGNS